MDALSQIKDDERFERQLAHDAGMTPEEKRKRLKQVNSLAKLSMRHEMEDGQRFDVLEYPDDVPIMPWYGNRLPSEMVMGDKRKGAT